MLTFNYNSEAKKHFYNPKKQFQEVVNPLFRAIKQGDYAKKQYVEI